MSDQNLSSRLAGSARWAMLVHAVPTIGLLGQGLLYMTTPTFMPYHGDALVVNWEQLPANYQGFLLGVIKGLGAGSIGVTVALFVLLAIPFRRGEPWAHWAVPVIGILFTTLTAYAAYTIDVRTPASPPWRLTLAVAATYVAGAIVSFWSWPRGADERNNRRNG